MCNLSEKVSESTEKESMLLKRNLFHEHHLYMVKKSLDFWE